VTDEPTDQPTDEPTAAVETARPVLRVLTPGTTPEEVAAIVAVLAALGDDDQAPPPRRTPEWSRPGRAHRTPVAHGPGGWRASGLPR